jgi:hypothetical protein
LADGPIEGEDQSALELGGVVELAGVVEAAPLESLEDEAAGFVVSGAVGALVDGFFW